MATEKLGLSLLTTWFFGAVIILGVCLLVYASGQQILRQNANDPQVQIAEDLSQKMANNPNFELTGEDVDMANSLSPFVIIYDKNGNMIAANGKLNGTVPEIPIGSLNTAKDQGQNRITWQPQNNVRIAAVIKHYTTNTNEDRYVLVGRSLREVEVREDALFNKTLVGWLLLEVVLSTVLFLQFLIFRKNNKS